jgi:hypothetical protein
MTNETMRVDVLVLGGGCGGTAAGWQAARMGAKVLVVESSPWLGGMITSAGVSALDGNKGAMATGLLRYFRDQLELYYGGREAVRTGWVSDTCYEPRVGARILAEFADEAGMEVWHGAQIEYVYREGNRLTAARIRRANGVVRVEAKVIIEGTEFGDVLEMAGVPYRLGRDPQSDTGEPDAPEVRDMEIQDMTWVAILRRQEEGQTYPYGHRVEQPRDYNPLLFDCTTKEFCSRPDPSVLNHPMHDWDSFISYGYLPNRKAMLNWPFHGNDFPDTPAVFGSIEDRSKAFARARRHTLSYVHYIQTTLGHPEWGLDLKEFDTPDRLAYIPYVRESRRGRGVRFMVEQDVLPPVKGGPRARFQPDSIAVGDYFLDHHHSKCHLPPGERLVEELPDNAPFQIPMGVVIPEEVDGLLLAEKNISVSHIVNGCSRLQPVVMLTGQAVGVIAALAAERNIQPREVSVADVQRQLVHEERVLLYPFNDLEHTHPHFVGIQTAAMQGLLADDQPMLFKPDEPIPADEVAAIARRAHDKLGANAADIQSRHRAGQTRGEFLTAITK